MEQARLLGLEGSAQAGFFGRRQFEVPQHRVTLFYDARSERRIAEDNVIALVAAERPEQGVALLDICEAPIPIQQHVEYRQMHRQWRDVVTVQVRGYVDAVAFRGDLLGPHQKIG